MNARIGNEPAHRLQSHAAGCKHPTESDSLLPSLTYAQIDALASAAHRGESHARSVENCPANQLVARVSRVQGQFIKGRAKRLGLVGRSGPQRITRGPHSPAATTLVMRSRASRKDAVLTCGKPRTRTKLCAHNEALLAHHSGTEGRISECAAYRKSISSAFTQQVVRARNPWTTSSKLPTSAGHP
jgi:hypothetical protein